MDSSKTSRQSELTTFVSGDYYILGAGETIDDIQKNGEWLAVENPMDVRL